MWPATRTIVGLGWLMLATLQQALAASEKSVLSDGSGKFTGTYLCIAEASGGAQWNAVTEQWESAVFSTQKDRTIVRVQKGPMAKTIDFDGSPKTAITYKVSIGGFGEPTGQCTSHRYGEKLFISNAGLIRCASGLTEYRVHLGEMRFMRVIWRGYWFKGELGKYTPAMTVGKCERISD